MGDDRVTLQDFVQNGEKNCVDNAVLMLSRRNDPEEFECNESAFKLTHNL